MGFVISNRTHASNRAYSNQIANLSVQLPLYIISTYDMKKHGQDISYWYKTNICLHLRQYYLYLHNHRAIEFRTEVLPRMWSIVLSCNWYVVGVHFLFFTKGTMITGFDPE